MKVVLLIAGTVVVVLIALVLIVVIIGYRLPQQHVASRSIRLNRTTSEVYAVVRDFSGYPTWRSDVKSVEMLEADRVIRFREHGKHSAVTYEVVEDKPNEKLVTRIVDQDLGYSGSWTYVFAPSNAGTRLTITENGEVSNPVFRFMSRYVFGHTTTIDFYLTNLAKHLGEPAPQVH